MPAKAQASEQSGKITATVSQSRFHKDVEEFNSSKDIDIRDLTLSVGQHELLSHCNIHLHAGKHYVLVGRNGTGKSTLLKALDQGIIPGVSRSIRILLLGQNAIAEAEDGADGNASATKDVTVLEHVLQSDKHLENLLEEQRILSKALESSDDALAPVRAMRQLSLKDTKQRYAVAAELADYRSGARGIKARKELIAAEAQLADTEAHYQQESSTIDADAITRDTSAAVDRLTEVQSLLAALDSDSAESRARTILKGLGFKDDKIAGKYDALSGGWRTRCVLAAALFQSSDVLLLDECTNFLDLPAILWLQTYIQDLTDKTVVVITHDRAFADAVAVELLVLREQKLEKFNGNLSTYEREKRKYAKWMTRMRDASDKATAHMEKTIAGNIAAAKRAGDDKKLKQAASRRKKLDERSGLEVSAKGTRFKLNRDRAGYYADGMRNAFDIPKMDAPVRMALPATPPELRPTTGALVSFDAAWFHWPGAKLYTLKDVALVIHPGQRVGLVGLNGAGKSTLIQLVAGAEDPAGARPSKGRVDVRPRARIACYGQHCVEELEERAARDPQLTALRELKAAADDAGMTEQDARALLGGVGLHGRTVSEVPVAALSGGQKVRLALVRLLVPPPHLLVLDEVTSHLDADTVTALAVSLRSYQGALLVVTHDRFFMKAVVEQEPIDQGASDDEESDGDDSEDETFGEPGVVWRVTGGTLKKLEGGMSEYEEICLRTSRKAGGKF
ncbi:hypothetical protein FH972_026546 [Carpinus fangiana]|uniref:ABC transporter domain-containing protein n=1 Tax=Carpinus fangiana TaxID=176857 RepID=A0A5N6L595_9ROSI|nr:hypothetical protein FH972_026546 [Carpinus fangiana]